ncbi:hypothetical protein SEPCBS57363_002588 [Sporothrix epigloea]|uniref:Uncharacterized protein n=1 Tax=Sporothrix epigloea TaxID=1892477 RepID=A0ABP0DGP0_9PEZI
MFSTLNFVKAMPLALMLSTALANPVPETSPGSDLGKRMIGNDATVLYCVTADYQSGVLATYTNGDTRQTVSWKTGNPTTTNAQVVESNQDWLLYELYRKHTNDAGFWLNIDYHSAGASFTIGYNPTGASNDLGNAGKASSKSTDHDYLNGRCLNEFGSDFSDVAVEYGSSELFWNDLDQKLY